MSTATDQTNRARIARAAAELIDANGRVIGDFVDYGQLADGARVTECRVCPVGAIRLAVAMEIARGTGEMVRAAHLVDDGCPLADEVEQALADWLVRCLGAARRAPRHLADWMSPGSLLAPVEIISCWADAQDRGDAEVTAALRAFADGAG